MKKIKKSIKIELQVFGYLYLIIGFLALFYSVYVFKNYDQIFWYCYSAFILVGLGLITFNSTLIAVQLNYLLIPLIIWNIDFFYRLISKSSLFGITDYFFEPGYIIPKIVTIQHLFILIVMFYALYLLKINKKNLWILSFLQIVIMYFLIRSVTSIESNINCVFKPCIQIVDIAFIYPGLWIVGSFAMIILSNFILIKLFYKRTK